MQWPEMGWQGESGCSHSLPSGGPGRGGGDGTCPLGHPDLPFRPSTRPAAPAGCFWLLAPSSPG